MPTTFPEERARVVVLARYRHPNDPEPLAACRRMREGVLVDVITRAFQKAPPLSPQLRERIITLLGSSQESGDCRGAAARTVSEQLCQ